MPLPVCVCRGCPGADSDSHVRVSDSSLRAPYLPPLPPFSSLSLYLSFHYPPHPRPPAPLPVSPSLYLAPALPPFLPPSFPLVPSCHLPSNPSHLRNVHVCVNNRVVVDLSLSLSLFLSRSRSRSHSPALYLSFYFAPSLSFSFSLSLSLLSPPSLIPSSAPPSLSAGVRDGLYLCCGANAVHDGCFTLCRCLR